jgi:1,4-dihydroxy-2-naphthoate octaprenyltransferase
VLVATWLAFGLAVAAGAYLIALVGWELLAIGAASILAGVLYTGGPRPYGYEGLGELFVFGFFGIVAVVGSYYVQVEKLRGLAFLIAVPVGLLAASILIVNNIRDIETDRRAGKRTLAVRLGRRRARRLFAAVVYASFLWTAAVSIFSGKPALQLMWLSAGLAPNVVRTVATRTDGPSLNGALAGTGRILAAFSVLVSVGLLLS